MNNFHCLFTASTRSYVNLITKATVRVIKSPSVQDQAGAAAFSAYHADLLGNVRKYIALRIQLTSRRGMIVDVKQNKLTLPVASDPVAMQADSSQAAGSSPRDEHVNIDSPAEVQNDTHNGRPTASIAPNLQSPVIELPSSGQTTRVLLQQIAQVSEEALRASEEKVNIAQTAYETVLPPFFRFHTSNLSHRLTDTSVFWTKLSRSKRHLFLLESVQAHISLRYFFLTLSYPAGYARPVQNIAPHPHFPQSFPPSLFLKNLQKSYLQILQDQVEAERRARNRSPNLRLRHRFLRKF